MPKQLNINQPDNDISSDNMEQGAENDLHQMYKDDFASLSDEELEELKANRRERYTEYRTQREYMRDTKPVSPKLVIGSIIAIFVYFMTVFILKTVGIFSELVMAILILPVVAGFIIAYLIYRNKNK